MCNHFQRTKFAEIWFTPWDALHSAALHGFTVFQVRFDLDRGSLYMLSQFLNRFSIFFHTPSVRGGTSQTIFQMVFKMKKNRLI